MAAGLASSLVLPGAALAHAVLVQTEPANDAVLAQAPRQVTLRFSEQVETAFGAVRVLAGDGSQAGAGDVGKPRPNTVSIGLESGLRHGTYTVAWRVVSADAHPVHGAFVFSVGKRGAAAPASAIGSPDTPRYVSVGFTVVRFLGFAALLACIGGVLSTAFVCRDVDWGVRRRLFAFLAGAAVLVALTSLAGIVFQGASGGGFGLVRALHGDVISQVLDTRFGQVSLARAGLALLLVAIVVAWAALGDRRSWLVGVAAVAVAGGLAWTPGGSGHASVGGRWEMTADTVHVLAAAVWAGGLAFVMVALLSAENRWGLAARVVPRFSTTAVAAVGALVAAGVVSGYLEVRAWHLLWETTYGQLLIAKVGLILPLLGLGAYNNRYAVPRLRGEIASPVEQRRFLRVAGAEVMVFLLVIGVTAVLVREPPAKAELLRPQPVRQSAAVGPYRATVTVDPARVGTNTIHVALKSSADQPAQLAEVRVELSLREPRLGPLNFKGHRLEPGVWAVHGAVLAIPGDWQLRLAVRRGEFDEWAARVSIPIKGG